MVKCSCNISAKKSEICKSVAILLLYFRLIP